MNNLIADKNSLHKAYVNRPTDGNKAAFCRSRRLVKQRLWEMQEAWMAHKAEGLQGYVDRNEWKNFFAEIKAVYDPPTTATAPPLGADGTTLLTGKTQILQRRTENFRGVLSRPSTIFDAATARLPQVETSAENELAPSIMKQSRPCSSFPAAKRPDRTRSLLISTSTAATDLYLTKAFDTANRDGLWKILQKFGRPERLTQMVRQLHDGMMARATENGAVSGPFAVTNGVKQGCVLAPNLFNLMFSAMLMEPTVTNALGSASPTGRIANSSTTGGCTSSHMYP
ncbi:hypothetical protein SprV_0100310000 [Sparganum proliferum]